MKYCVVILMILTGCNPLKKAVRTFDEYPAAAALYCADRFPVRDSVYVRDSISYDTVVRDSMVIVRVPLPLINRDDDTIYVTVPCPPSKVITKTIRRDSTIIRRDIARETVLKNTIDDQYLNLIYKDKQIGEFKEKYAGMKKKRNWWRIACLITWGLIGIGLVWKVRSKLPI